MLGVCMKYLNLAIVLVLVLWFIGAGCKPREIEGTIVHMQAKRLQEAYDLALVAVEKYPQNSEAWFLLGKIQGDRKESPLCTQKSTKGGPEKSPQIELYLNKSNLFDFGYNNSI